MGRANSLETLAVTFGDDDCDLDKTRGEEGGGAIREQKRKQRRYGNGLLSRH